ncbi:MAG: GNAT family N-acetyltransferase [Rhodobacteraceae bacterium]|nr:GNAT family N-acetyltransferase [Paracoccaceae bacterium]
MTPTIHPLDPATDTARVYAFWPDAADYIVMERGEAPGPTLNPVLTQEFFTDAPPGIDPATSLRLGLFVADRLLGVAELAFGYPGPQEAYLGLMVLGAPARGTGSGRALLRRIEAEAIARHAPALYLAVLDANPRGRAFWEREGFTLHEAGRSVTIGAKTQTAARMVKRLG